MPGLIIAAPCSGAGKTTVTLALLRLLALMDHPVRAAKSGPGQADPQMYEAASGTPGMNLDTWAMTPDRIRALACDDRLLLIDGAAGLFDGTPPEGRGAVADLARILDLTTVLVVDAARMGQSVAPLVAGFAIHDPEVRIGGIILNRVQSPDHAALLRQALEPLGLPVLAALPDHPDLALPAPELALARDGDRPLLDPYLDRAAALLAEGIPGDLPPDLATLLSLASPLPGAADSPRIDPPAQTIAVARDEAFAFAYPHLLADWRAAGAEITFFSPLADDPVPRAGFVFLPGGHPERYAGRIAAAGRFLTTLRAHGERKPTYGEGGGYMVLGDVLTDADGVPHAMTGLLSLATSFKKRRPQQGYSILTAAKGPFAGTFHALEDTEAATLYQSGDPLFTATDAAGKQLPPMGLREGRASGSFAHIIDRA